MVSKTDACRGGSNEWRNATEDGQIQYSLAGIVRVLFSMGVGQNRSGSMGRNILGFHTELMLDHGSLAAETDRVSLDFFPDHFVGFDKKWVRPEGELEWY